ncbi:uncharacterized protein MYCFIDRAFT_46639 [Pseudocercospora fijiensis CIRAD86]|uniref:Major facilitator superfamily (MFS) profile domain-containing protein n=1 Tax=Pseudocercospora fijiensis (strain CIRAD86) TaxID=383855 RepID=M3B785_PSEFD|nr:uncharacterized protein MYCFIDRAFT_46639 [Pseudocercospora fijiensis CIRAD86]EME85183.1 hypothetical protein MYCFIDRAFT_46639 [Pseudocercospora fijiensis CIRAD86]
MRSILALAGSALAYFCTVGFLNAYGVFQQYYTAHYLPTYSNFQISWIGSFSTFMLFGAAAPAGMIADRFGPTIPILCGSIVEVFAIFMVSLCREYYQFFLAQGVLLPIGMSFIAISTSTVVPQYFIQNRGLAQGVSIGGSSLGGILWPVALDQLLNHDGIGFGWSMRIVGFVLIPLLALALLCLRTPKKTQGDHDAEANKERNIEDKPKSKKKDYSKMKQPAFIFMCLGLATAYFGFFAPLFYVSVYATHLGLSENLAFYLVSILNGASLFGRIMPGIFADKYGHFNILTCSAFFSAIVVFCWTKATSIAGLVVWSIAYGFTSGAIMSLQLACATIVADEQTRGAAVGLAMASVSLTALFGTPIAGELVEKGYLALSAFAGAMLIVGAILLGCARFSRNQKPFAKI